MAYKAIIFDLDGTILDTLQDLANSLNHALRTHGYPERSLDEVRRFIGNGIKMLVRRGCPADTSEEALEAALATFRVHYDAHCKDFTGPYEGIHALLDSLLESGIRTAVVSNKSNLRSSCCVMSTSPESSNTWSGTAPIWHPSPPPTP